MKLSEVLAELKSYGDEQTKKTLMRHGAKEPIFGVKVADLKKILKKTKKNHDLSLELYKTGNSDAMYLAALMADEKKITEAQLDEWVDQAYWSNLNEYAVPWVAGETPMGFKIGLKWIKSKKETTAAAGWSTLSSFASVNLDSDLDIPKYSELLDHVEKHIHQAQNRVKYAMNVFIISVGSHIKELNPKAIQVAQNIGTVTVDMGGTSCKVPLAKDYIDKVTARGSLGKKKSTARC